jgi:hypothetical protein
LTSNEIKAREMVDVVIHTALFAFEKEQR